MLPIVRRLFSQWRRPGRRGRVFTSQPELYHLCLPGRKCILHLPRVSSRPLSDLPEVRLLYVCASEMLFPRPLVRGWGCVQWGW